MQTILIVDDSAFTRSFHKDILESNGYATIEAASGAEAFQAFKGEKPDAVIVDLLMPEMDGMDVVRQIIEMEPGAKVFVCSTDRQSFRQEEAKEAGALGFLAKPVDGEQLLDALAREIGA